MKLNLGKILSIVSIVQPLVQSAQERFKGKKTGAEKKEAVIETLRAIVPAVEDVTGRDLFDDESFERALSALVDAEKAVLVARERVQAFVDAAKGIRTQA